MRIKSIQINNYRSLGNNDNILRFDSDIITLIGKNETGKSNVLLALDGLEFFKPSKNAAFAEYNKFRPGNKISFKFEIEILNSDLAVISKTWHTEKSTVTFYFEEDANNIIAMRFDGCLKGIMQEDPIFASLQNETLLIIEQVLKQHPTDTNLQSFQLLVRNSDSIFIPVPNYVTTLKQNYLKGEDNKASRQTLDGFLEKRANYYGAFSSILPIIINFDSTMLKDSYTHDELTANKDALVKKDSALNRYFKAIGISSDEFLQANIDHKQNEHHTLRTRINKANNKLATSFNQFYNTEQIGFEVSFDSKRYTFLFTSGEASETFMFSERSTGLRWFFSCFMELERSGAAKRALILVDEPACHLHVNAQKKVLDLFKSLAGGGRQIIYTTHSPYMIDPSALSEIKVVTKDQYITRITDIHKVRFEGESEMETLTPLARALDCDFCHNIGPSFKKSNLIVEGITDYYYLTAMIDFFDVPAENRPFVIPCIGADNISRLVSIMIGWGCDFKVLYDSDQKGKDAARVLEQLLVEKSEFDSHVFFVSPDSGQTIENLLSSDDTKELRASGKQLKAKMFKTLVVKGTLEPSKETCTNFKRLLGHLLVIE